MDATTRQHYSDLIDSIVQQTGSPTTTLDAILKAKVPEVIAAQGITLQSLPIDSISVVTDTGE